MKRAISLSPPKLLRYTFLLFLIACCLPVTSRAQNEKLCLDGFCIGQSIKEARFDEVTWIVPQKNLTREECKGVGCQPNVAFRGYTREDQAKLAEAVTWKFSGSLLNYNLVTKVTLPALRLYRYECDPSAGGIWGERRFIGAYRSTPSNYLTVIGLRPINGDLRVYRIARQFPYHNQDELVLLAKELAGQYGHQILLYDGISSNAYSDVIAQRRDGWFGRSTLFNPTDLADNAAELVLIDPLTRSLLEPTSMPESGDIKPLPPSLPQPCTRQIPLQ